MILDGFAREIFLDKYASPGETEWADCVIRVARYVSQAENSEQLEWQEKFFDMMKDTDFIPGGRILVGAGKPRQSMLNCFSLEPEDNANSLGNLLRDSYLISVQGGGIGMSFSKIRPRGDNIQHFKYSAPGVISEMKKIDSIGQETKSGKNRRGALLAVLNIEHPDILDFLHVKLDLNLLNNFNISIGITNDFIRAVEKNRSWHFKFNNRTYYVFELRRTSKKKKEKIRIVALDIEDALGRAYAGHKLNVGDTFDRVKQIDYKAKDLWNTLIKNVIRCGDPGIFNLDMVNNYTNVGYFEFMAQPNPCGELPLPNYGSCCLGSINLSNMYDEKKNDVAWKHLAKTIKVAVRFLDNVITLNNYPLPMNKEVGHRSRRIGLGVMGLHYLLIKLGYRYGDSACLEFLERLFATIRNEAYMASVEIAKERGAFPAFDAEKYLKEEFAKTLPQRIRRAIKKYGIRNATILTCAPTGTTSIIAKTSSGIEPIFAPVYKRAYKDPQNLHVWKYTIVVDRLFQEFYNNNKDTKHIVGAYDISPEEHLNVQATIQRFIDSSISKTINVPEDVQEDKLSSIILEFIGDLKGVTVYRQNSRGVEPLRLIDISDSKKLEKIMKEAKTGVDSVDNCKSGKCDL